MSTGRDYSDDDLIPPWDPASRHYRSPAELERRDWEECDRADKARKERGVIPPAARAELPKAA